MSTATKLKRQRIEEANKRMLGEIGDESQSKDYIADIVKNVLEAAQMLGVESLDMIGESKTK